MAASSESKGINSMPQIGQSPGSFFLTFGCIEQVQTSVDSDSMELVCFSAWFELELPKNNKPSKIPITKKLKAIRTVVLFMFFIIFFLSKYEVSLVSDN